MRKLVYMFPFFMFLFMFVMLYLLNIYVIHHSRPLFGATVAALTTIPGSFIIMPSLLNIIRWREEKKKKDKPWY